LSSVNTTFSTRDVLVRVFFFGAFAFILYQLFLLARPFLTAMLGAAMLSMIFYPLHTRMVRWLHNETGAALISTFIVLVLGVLPLVGMGWFFIREATELAPVAKRVLDEARSRDWPALEAHLPAFLHRALNFVSTMFDRMNVDFKQVLLENAQMVGSKVTYWASQALRNIAVTLLNLLILSIALFFAFKDGQRLLQWALSLVPMQSSHKHIVAQRIYETFRAVIVGSFLTASAQGILAMLGFLVAGVKLPVVLGIATSLSAMLGASVLVTLPVAFSLLRENTGWGIFLLFWALGVVGVVDNFLKPLLIGSRARMPFILIFFSIIGGVKLYGLLGFILGPMLVASFLSFVKIYREEYNANK
jgi:predicted PurR-regulated permease PerM